MDTALRYTDAPRASDLDGTTSDEYVAGVDTAGRTWRAVQIPHATLDLQASAYRAGHHATMLPRDWVAAVREGIVRRPDVTHERTGHDGTRYVTKFTDDLGRARAYRAAGLASGATFSKVFQDSVIAAYRVAIHYAPAACEVAS